MVGQGKLGGLSVINFEGKGTRGVSDQTLAEKELIE